MNMQVSIKSRKSQVTIRLSFLEVRQLLSSTAAVEEMRQVLKKAYVLQSPKGGK
jgi:UTP:GlnB (protein PII) uridylyltransferase